MGGKDVRSTVLGKKANRRVCSSLWKQRDIHTGKVHNATRNPRGRPYILAAKSFLSIVACSKTEMMMMMMMMIPFNLLSRFRYEILSRRATIGSMSFFDRIPSFDLPNSNAGQLRVSEAKNDFCVAGSSLDS
jgi:hypothetical protein